MAHHYRSCKKCHVHRDLVPISKRGLCARCATYNALQAVAVAVAASAALQVKVPEKDAPR